jgi:hypothetical protein
MVGFGINIYRDMKHGTLHKVTHILVSSLADWIGCVVLEFFLRCIGLVVGSSLGLKCIVSELGFLLTDSIRDLACADMIAINNQ